MMTTGTSPVESPVVSVFFLVVSHASHGHKARGGKAPKELKLHGACPRGKNDCRIGTAVSIVPLPTLDF